MDRYKTIIILLRAFTQPVTETDPRQLSVVQKVTFLGNTDNVNFGWFAYDSTDGHPKKCYPILNHALYLLVLFPPLVTVPARWFIG